MLNTPKTVENAGILALEGLGWLAGAEGGLDRFLAAGGMDLSGLRAAAASREAALAIVEFLLANEDLLLGFCSDAAIAPAAVHAARRLLEGPMADEA